MTHLPDDRSSISALRGCLWLFAIGAVALAAGGFYIVRWMLS